MAQEYKGNSRLAKAVLIAVLVAATGSAQAAPVSQNGMEVVRGVGWRDITPAEAVTLVETYFNNLTTVQADFTQSVSSERTDSKGVFYLKRPRQFLWQYETPVRQKIVGTGTAVFFVDQSTGKDGQVTQLPMDAGMGRLFSAKVLRLKNSGLTVTAARENASAVEVEMAVSKGKDDRAGLKNVRLAFAKRDGGYELHEISALDVTQAETRVVFSNVKNGAALPRGVFDFTPGVYRNAN